MTHRWLPVLFFFGFMPIDAFGIRFEIKDVAFRNLFYLVSDAPLEKILAQSSGVEGFIELNPKQLKDGIKGQLSVDLRALDSGSEARNELIRDRILSAAENPVLSFEFAKASRFSAESLRKEVPLVIRAEGQLRVRGTARPFSIHLRVFYFPENEATRGRLPGNLIKISATFDLNLADFGLTVPEASVSRVASVLHIAIDALATDANLSPVVLPTSDAPKPKERDARGAPARAPTSDTESPNER